jgi:RNA polymerase sigma-70 factor (ECF subfamily)
MDDLQVIAKIRAGDTGAFEWLVRRYQRPLLHYLGRMGIREAEAEELAQETFIRAYRNLSAYEPHRALFSTWLFTIARRLALNLLARRRHESDTQFPSDMPDPTAHTDDVCDHAVTKRRINMALAQLPLKYRSPLCLAYLGELSIAEIAQIEGCAEGTVKSRIHRGKQRLMVLLADLLGDNDYA